MSLIASPVKTNDSSFSLSQEINLPDKNNNATSTISKTDNFNPSDKTFPIISQNIESCQYINVNNISSTNKHYANILTRMKNLARKLYFHHKLMEESKSYPQKTKLGIFAATSQQYFFLSSYKT